MTAKPPTAVDQARIKRERAHFERELLMAEAAADDARARLGVLRKRCQHPGMNGERCADCGHERRADCSWTT